MIDSGENGGQQQGPAPPAFRIGVTAPEDFSQISQRRCSLSRHTYSTSQHNITAPHVLRSMTRWRSSFNDGTRSRSPTSKGSLRVQHPPLSPVRNGRAVRGDRSRDGTEIFRAYTSKTRLKSEKIFSIEMSVMGSSHHSNAEESPVTRWHPIMFGDRIAEIFHVIGSGSLCVSQARL